MVLRISVLLAYGEQPEPKLGRMFAWRMDACCLGGMCNLSAGEAGGYGAERGMFRSDSGTDIGEQGFPHTGDKATVQGSRCRTLAGPLGHAYGYPVRGLRDGDAKSYLYKMEMARFLWNNAFAMVLCRDDGLSKEPHPCSTDDIAGFADTGVR